MYKEYIRLKKEESELKKKLKDLKKDIEEDMITNKVNIMNVEDNNLEIVTRTTQSMDEVGAIEKLKGNGKEHLIEIEYKIDEDKFIEEVMGGNIPEDFLDEFIETKVTKYVKIGKGNK